jgi:hypothetical protein
MRRDDAVGKRWKKHMIKVMNKPNKSWKEIDCDGGRRKELQNCESCKGVEGWLTDG